ncbi:MAG: hypothetical protein ACFCU2_06045, partial [Acidimicrobiia bacterium]
MNRAFRTLLGSTDLKTAGYARVWRGLRVGDRRDLYLGVTLALISVLRQNSGGKDLIFRKRLPEVTALVIHHKKKGDPK